MWRIISCIMLYIISWRSQRLVMAPCETAITKSLAWLVEHLVVSSHKFSSLFTLFSKLFSKSFYHFSIDVFIAFLVHLCFHLFHHKFFSFSFFKSLYHTFTLCFTLLLSCFILPSIFLFFLYRFQNHFLIIFISTISSPSPPITSSFIFLFFSLSLTKKNY